MSSVVCHFGQTFPQPARSRCPDSGRTRCGAARQRTCKVVSTSSSAVGRLRSFLHSDPELLVSATKLSIDAPRVLFRTACVYS